MHIIRANGALIRKSTKELVSIENVKTNWEKIVDMEGAQRYDSIHESTAALVTALEQLRSSNNDAEAPTDTNTFSYNHKDLILYALGGKSSILRLVFINCF